VFEEEREAFLEAGCDAFIEKPVNLEELYGEMARRCGVEWVYAEDPVAQQEPQMLDMESIAMPPAEELQRLDQLLRRGRVKEVLEQASGESDGDYPEFYAQIVELGKAYKVKQLKHLIRSALE
jgi:CheY-like chemotaxis protein